MATDFATRLALWRCHKAGLGAPQLAQRFDLPPRTVRNLLARFRRDGRPSPPSLHRTPRPPLAR
jgi:Homeodomain-like domain